MHLVDHVGVRYDPSSSRRQQAPSDRTFRLVTPTCATTMSPTSLVQCHHRPRQHSHNRPWMTRDKLWINYLRQQGCFQLRPPLGHEHPDVILVFDHLDRKVTVLDGEGTVVYPGKDSRRYDHNASPQALIMTENHVTMSTRLDQPTPPCSNVTCGSSKQRVLRDR